MAKESRRVIQSFSLRADVVKTIDKIAKATKLKKSRIADQAFGLFFRQIELLNPKTKKNQAIVVSDLDSDETWELLGMASFLRDDGDFDHLYDTY